MQLEQGAKPVKDQALHQNNQQRHPDDDDRIGEQQVKVDTRPHGDEEQPQQQSFERLKVGFQFVPEFAAGQHHSCKEGPKRGRQAHQHHQEGNPDDDQQGQSGIHLAQLGSVDKPENGAGEEHTGDDDPGNGTQGDQRYGPTRQPLNQ